MSLILLDYGRPNPFGETLGRPRRLAWPVNVYRVTLPKESKEDEKLNPFELVILKLIDAGAGRDAETLAQETCLPKDLVHCVLLRLRDKEYIDEYNQIITQQRDKWSDQTRKQPEYTTACVFRELATAKILPYLHFLKDNPLTKREPEEEEEKRYYRHIRWNEDYRKCVPTPHDVVAALRAMQKRTRAFGKELRLPSVQLITIVKESELYYLDCPIAIQKSDGEFRISDPFGNGFSLVLESAFSCLLEKDKELRDWLMAWKMSLSNRGQDSQSAVQREPYDNDANWAHYPKLLQILRLGRGKQFRSIEQIYAAIEWALFYCCAQRSYALAVQQLKLTNQSEHPALLRKAAEDLSLELPPAGLFPVRDGKLNDFLEGKAELGTVVSLALLMAAGDPIHPLRRLAAAHPDFILRLLKIKKNRDELAHGVGGVRPTYVELPEEAFMREVVTALLPTVRFADRLVAGVDRDAVSDSVLDARTSIQGEFGFALFNRLGANLQDRLIAAERFWLFCKQEDNAIAFACDLYAAVQAAFRKCLTGALPPDVRESEYVANAKKKAEVHGLGDLPECLLMVKRTAIRETLLGNDQTLQSCVVAFLLVASEEILNAIAQIQPSFIADVTLVIERRGHGNEPLLLPKEEIRPLRKAAYTTIKTLLEA